MNWSSIAWRLRFTAENGVQVRCCGVWVILLKVSVPGLDWGKMGRLPRGRYNSISTCEKIWRNAITQKWQALLGVVKLD